MVPSLFEPFKFYCINFIRKFLQLSLFIACILNPMLALQVKYAQLDINTNSVDEVGFLLWVNLNHKCIPNHLTFYADDLNNYRRPDILLIFRILQK